MGADARRACLYLPQAYCALKAAACDDAKGARVYKAVHAGCMDPDCVKHLRTRRVTDFYGPIQRARQQPQLRDRSHLVTAMHHNLKGAMRMRITCVTALSSAAE